MAEHTRDCPGYRQAPYPGSLWPNETSDDFGYPVGADGTVARVATARGQAD